ncbi:MAG: YcxB family protein [Micropruina sp.]|uniref:YcxB family protein n=1 Tax=Micropruina sp. TaxID=2737536 RepID=UPI0039E6CBC5
MRRLQYELTDDDYIAFHLQVYRSAPTFVAYVAKQRRMMTIVLVVLLLALGLLLTLIDQESAGSPTDGFLFALPVAVVAGLISWFGWPWFHRVALESQLRNLAGRGALGRTGPVVLSWDDFRVYQEFPGTGGYADWARIRRIDEGPEHLFLTLEETEALIVPKRIGPAAAEFAHLARTRVPGR